ncbi:oxidoreductase [Rugosimonospora africana]|uniref:Short-chain dehydrogenase n=1 Tax=Rugosimonospora africana TaxID=556532 RepID=A0A8J3VQ23_9ACTN|nr:oxidoreductase [Rugosimonospora africana]GIH14021.1 short-chain dehydrogenase [Rugosimonospora africana]
MSRWTDGWVAGEVGDQRGRTAVVTGANTGIGFETATVLAAHGATVVLACRDAGRANAAAARIAGTVPDAAVDPLGLDLASLASVCQAADRIRSRYPRLDLLINNAGLMMPPFGRTEDGFERQFGTNHLGHFALTGRLLDRLLPTPGARIVTVSSLVHRGGRIDFDDLHFARRRYRRPAAYSQSKLANLMFTLELQRRLAAAAARPVALAAEPGLVPTELPRHTAAPARLAVWLLTRLAGQPDAATGALATLRAATDPRARGGEYYGPDGRLLRASGHPVRIEPSEAARDPEAQRRLWAESERLTGVTYRFGGPA